ncbi:hypothetical protein TNCV_3449751 [Trichonephila clavipes]|nr:hypothetical protein TNCV_3449751 [Trichonephila clavipes]
MNIPHTAIMSALDLRSGYFQLAVNPSDIVDCVRDKEWHLRILPYAIWLARGGSQFSEGNRHHTKTSDWEICECVHG